MTTSDALRVRNIADAYRQMSHSLKREAFLKRMRQEPLTARVLDEYARIARVAAIAEEVDPEPRQ